MPAAPAIMVWTKTLVAGDVDEVELEVAVARVGEAEVMVMPRAFSSGSPSQSMPVSGLTRVVLPWSMWPAGCRRRRGTAHGTPGATG